MQEFDIPFQKKKNNTKWEAKLYFMCFTIHFSYNIAALSTQRTFPRQSKKHLWSINLQGYRMNIHSVVHCTYIIVITCYTQNLTTENILDINVKKTIYYSF